MDDRSLVTERGVPTLEDTERIREISAHFRRIIELLGLDLTDPNLVETPERVAKMYLELFEGLMYQRAQVRFVVNDENGLHPCACSRGTAYW